MWGRGSGRYSQGSSCRCCLLSFYQVFSEVTTARFNLDGVVAGLAGATSKIGGTKIAEVFKVADGFGLAVFSDAGYARSAAKGSVPSGSGCGFGNSAISCRNLIVGLSTLKSFVLRFAVIANINKIFFSFANIAF